MAICPICATRVRLLPSGTMKKHQRANAAKIMLGERCYQDGLYPLGTPRGDEMARCIIERLRQRADELDSAHYPSAEEAVENYKRFSPYYSGPAALASLVKDEEWLKEQQDTLAQVYKQRANNARKHADALQRALGEISSETQHRGVGV